jgi:TolA-binding protein
VSRTRVIALFAAVTLLVGGCAMGEWKWPLLSWPGRTSPGPAASAVAGPPVPPPRGPANRVADPVQLLIRANEFVHDRMPLAARDLYERVIHDYPEHPVRAGALVGLGKLQADATSPLREYRVAYLTFGRVLEEHPRSRWESEARLWRGVLSELLTRDDEAHRLRVQLQKLRRIEVDLDKSR